MEAVKKEFEYQLEEEELTLETPSRDKAPSVRWFWTSLNRLKTALLAR
jgi:hypothetical protein